MLKAGELAPDQKRAATGKGTLALALAAGVSLLGVWEGTRQDPYRDSVGVKTVCTGETHVPMRHYSKAECAVMLRASFTTRLNAVAKLSPGIENKPYEWAAHASLVYNIGAGNYAKSSVRRLYLAGNDRAACEAIRRFEYAGGRRWKGLVLRREGDRNRLGEVGLCLTGLR